MRGHCIICSELFVASSEISAASCGHTFHYVCLTQWTERSKTCPQCRIKLNSKSVIQKLYFDAGPDLEPEEDPDQLRNKNSDLEAELLKSNKENTGLKEILEGQFKLNEALEKKSTENRNKLKAEKDLTASLKIQLECLSNETKRTRQLEKENVTLADRLKDFKNIEAILNGSDEEAQEILKSHGRGSAQMDQLAKYCGVLKNELSAVSLQKQRWMTKRKRLEMENAQLEKKVSRRCELEEAMALKDKKIQLLESKLKKAEKQIMLLREGSALQKCRNTHVLSLPEFTGSESLTGVVADKENDSPMIARCSVAACIAMAKDKPRRNLQDVPKVETEMYKDFNIMKRKPALSDARPSSAAGSSSSKGQGYDGLGGHSRPDIFPGGTAQPKRKIKLAVSGKASRRKTSNKSSDTTILID